MRQRPEADRDLAEQYAFITADNPDAADRFLAAAQTAFEGLDRLPRKGRRFESENPQLSGLRWWPIPGFKNHLVFYRVLEKEIEVVRVLYSTRDIAAVLEEEPS